MMGLLALLAFSCAVAAVWATFTDIVISRWKPGYDVVLGAVIIGVISMQIWQIPLYRNIAVGSLVFIVISDFAKDIQMAYPDDPITYFRVPTLVLLTCLLVRDYD